MRKVFYGLFIIILLISCKQSPIKHNPQDIKIPHYDVDLKIEPESNSIWVKGQLRLPVQEESLDQIAFYLHKQLRVDRFLLDGKDCVVLDKSTSDIRYMKEAMKVILNPTRNLSLEDVVKIDFSYHGTINEWPSWSPNVIGPDWVEMGLYFPWFPYHPEYTPFTYKLNVDMDPVYTVFAIGDMKQEESVRVFETQSPTNSIVVCASKDMKIIETKMLSNSIRVAYYSLDREMADAVLSDLEKIYSLYNQWFGEEEQGISLVESKRKQGGGYVRIGGLFLSGFEETNYFENRAGYHRYLGHELSHFWWYQADSTTWHDWLNESFAEYSALMVIRELIGKKDYNLRLKEYREESLNTPPLWGADRSHDSAHQIFYKKGPVLLSELEKKIGKKGFLDLCQKLVLNHCDETPEFLKILAAREGREISRWVENQLKTR
jgi:hypothetical protein